MPNSAAKKRSAPPDLDLAQKHYSNDTKKPRQPKFTQSEILIGLKMFASNRSFLVTQKGDKSTGMRKNELWASIAKSMSEESGNVRTIKQAKTKIHQIRSREKGPESERLLKRSLTGGGTPPDDASQEDQGGFTDEETQQDANLDQEIRSVAISTLVKEQLVGIGAFDTSRGKKFTKVCKLAASYKGFDTKDDSKEKREESSIPVTGTDFLDKYGPAFISLCAKSFGVNPYSC